MAGFCLHSQLDFYTCNLSYKVFRATEIMIFSVNNIWKGNNSIQWIFIKFHKILGLHLARPDFFFFKKDCIIIQHSLDFWLKKIPKIWWNNYRESCCLQTDILNGVSFRWPPILLLQLKSKISSKSIMGKIANRVTANRLIVSQVTWCFYITFALIAKKQSGKISRVIDTKS